MAAATIRVDTLEVIKKLNLSEIEAQDLEIGIFNASIDYSTNNKIPVTWCCEQFQEVYLAKARSMFMNLSKQTRLITRLKEKEFLPHELPYMKHDSLYPEGWTEIIDADMMRNKAAFEITQKSMTDQVICGKCKKNKVTYYELQTRSADEPMSQFYTCITCGNRWKT